MAIEQDVRTAPKLVPPPDNYNSANKDIAITANNGRTVEYGGKVVWFQPSWEME